MLRAVLIAAPLSVALHLLVGWEWAIFAGVAAGALAPRRGGRSGAVALSTAWGALLLWTSLVAPDATGVLIEILGGLLGGNTPGAAIVALMLVFSAALGGTGGLIGAQLRTLIETRASADAADDAPGARADA